MPEKNPVCDMPEMLDIVDKQDNVIGIVEKAECYKKGLRPRIVQIAIIDPVTNKVAVQRRGEAIRFQPGYYGMSVCGHVSAGEEWDVAAVRELREEMNIDGHPVLIDKSPFTDAGGQNFMLSTYILEASHSRLRGHEREVGQILPMDIVEIRELIARGEKLQNIFVFAMEKVLEHLYRSAGS